MGVSSKKTTTTSNQTSTPTNPQWVTDSLKDFTGKVNALGATDPTQYVAPAAQNQTLASQAAQRLSSDPGGLLSGAAGLVNRSVGGATPGYTASTSGGATIDPTSLAASEDALGGIQQYIDAASPYYKNVYDTTMSDFDERAAADSAAYEAAGARNHAFGGSRFGLGETNLTGQQERGRAATGANVLKDGYDRAVASATSDADRSTSVSLANAGAANARAAAQAGLTQNNGQFNAGAFNTAGLANAGFANDALTRALSGAGILGGLGTAEGQLGLSNLDRLASTGATDRGIDADYRTAPISLLQTEGGLLNQGQYGLVHGNETTGTSTQTTDPGLLGGIGQALGAVGSLGGLFSGGLGGILGGGLKGATSLTGAIPSLAGASPISLGSLTQPDLSSIYRNLGFG